MKQELAQAALQAAMDKIQEIQIAKNRDKFATLGDFEQIFLKGVSAKFKIEGNTDLLFENKIRLEADFLDVFEDRFCNLPTNVVGLLREVWREGWDAGYFKGMIDGMINSKDDETKYEIERIGNELQELLDSEETKDHDPT